MARRQLVLIDGMLGKDSKRPVHLKDVENCNDNTGEFSSNNTPLLPLDDAWTNCSLGSDFAKKRANNVWSWSEAPRKKTHPPILQASTTWLGIGPIRNKRGAVMLAVSDYCW